MDEVDGMSGTHTDTVVTLLSHCCYTLVTQLLHTIHTHALTHTHTHTHTLTHTQGIQTGAVSSCLSRLSRYT
jgi:hypothetical protein